MERRHAYLDAIHALEEQVVLLQGVLTPIVSLSTPKRMRSCSVTTLIDEEDLPSS